MPALRKIGLKAAGNADRAVYEKIPSGGQAISMFNAIGGIIPPHFD